ncbi:MAG: serine protein kinase RIO [Fervidicoccaceae archaeon]
MRRLDIIRVLGVVSAGKEARIYRAVTREGSELALKIYLTSTREFRKSIWKYIIGDPRFEREKITSSKKLMALWARKEYKNLRELFEAGVRVPEPRGVLENIVAMEFIGEEGRPAPSLRENPPQTSEEALELFNTLIHYVELSFCEAELVHADLSEYNVLVWRGRPVIIDVGQAVSIKHPNALEFLIKDLSNLTRYFGRELGLDVPQPSALLEVVTRCSERRRDRSAPLRST